MSVKSVSILFINTDVTTKFTWRPHFRGKMQVGYINEITSPERFFYIYLHHFGDPLQIQNVGRYINEITSETHFRDKMQVDTYINELTSLLRDQFKLTRYNLQLCNKSTNHTSTQSNKTVFPTTLGVLDEDYVSVRLTCTELSKLSLLLQL